MTVEWSTLSSLVISHTVVKSISLNRFSSVTQSCLTLCDPMDYSTPGLPVHHQFLELAQTHVHWVSDAIQPSHPLSSPPPQLQWWLLIGRCHLLITGQHTAHLQGSHLLCKTSWTTTTLYLSISWANALLMLWVVSSKPQLLLHQCNSNKTITKASCDTCHHL